MKKIIYSMAVVAITMSSCGGNSEICDCADMSLKMAKEMEGIEGEGSFDAMIEISKKYEADIEKCKKMGEGKSEEELEAMKAEMETCEASKELMKMKDAE